MELFTEDWKTRFIHRKAFYKGPIERRNEAKESG
jgi:hypothetical protein